MEILPISEMDAMYGDANTGYIKMRASMKDGKYEYRIINACMPVTSGEEVKAIVDDFISRTTNRSKISENRSEISENRSKINEIRSRPAAGRKKHHRWTDEERQDAIRRYAAGEDIDKIALDYGSTNMAIQKMMQKYKVRRPRIKPAAQPPVQPDPDTAPVLDDDEAEQERKRDLKEYRERNKKPWYLQKSQASKAQ
jgi:transposase-like protein